MESASKINEILPSEQEIRLFQKFIELTGQKYTKTTPIADKRSYWRHIQAVKLELFFENGRNYRITLTSPYSFPISFINEISQRFHLFRNVKILVGSVLTVEILIEV